MVILSHVTQPQDANPAGNIHGGVIMKLIDNAAGGGAVRHAYNNAVAASIDRLDFHYPVYVEGLTTTKKWHTLKKYTPFLLFVNFCYTCKKRIWLTEI